MVISVKGAVSRNSAKVGNYKMPVNNKHSRKVKITQQVQQIPRMGKTEEDWNGLKLKFLKTVQPNSVSNLISVVCNFKNNDLESLISSFTCNFFA